MIADDDLIEALDTFASLVAEILNHCGPLSSEQRRRVREAVDAWWDVRERVGE